MTMVAMEVQRRGGVLDWDSSFIRPVVVLGLRVVSEGEKCRIEIGPTLGMRQW